MAAAVHFRSAVALLGAFPALAGVDLEVGTGEIVLVRGPNGAGKTSLLRACAGLLPIVEGEAAVLGHDLLVDRRSVRRQVGLLGHSAGLYDDLPVEDNVVFAVRAAGVPTSAVGPALDRLGLGGRLRKVVAAKLSAGQRRRVAIASLVARWPPLWLLDEPHAGLDAEGRDLLDALVREAAAGGCTVVFASHESDRAGALAGRTVVMAGGRLRPEATGHPSGHEAAVVVPAGAIDGKKDVNGHGGMNGTSSGLAWGRRSGKEAGVGASAGEVSEE